MSVAVRSCLTAGISVLAVGLIAIPPSIPPPTPTAVLAAQGAQVAPRIDLAAAVRPLVVEPPTPQKFAAAVAAIERIDPSARKTALPAVTAAVAPVPLNAASDLIVSGYQFIQYWVDYGVQLTNYVLNFIPYGYLIAAQVNIFYYNLIRPIADSVVYQLIVPVVNDPLNLASYVNGFVNVGQATVNALINTGIAEFNYFFGWLIPPLPPLPLAVAKSVPTVEEEESTALAASVEPATEAAEPTTAPLEEEHLATGPETTPVPAVEKSTSTPIVTETDVETTTVVEEPATGLETIKPETTKPETTTSANGVQAQGEVRGSADVKDVPTTATPKDTDPKTPETKTPETKTPETKTAEPSNNEKDDHDQKDGQSSTRDVSRQST